MTNDDIRRALILEASKLLGVPYKFGAEWTDYSSTPKEIDCSEMIEGIFHIVGLKIPDGSQNQFNFLWPIENPLPGDLAFFGRGGKADKIYHTGLVYDTENIIEARAFDEKASFKTGEVILRPIVRWKNYANFVGFRRHEKLMEG